MRYMQYYIGKHLSETYKFRNRKSFIDDFEDIKSLPKDQYDGNDIWVACINGRWLEVGSRDNSTGKCFWHFDKPTETGYFQSMYEHDYRTAEML